MREIKFRGKDRTGKWHYGGYVEFAGSPRIIYEATDGPLRALCPVRVIPSTIGQFTGLHDANGKEIYEGDILNRNDAQFPMRGPVDYENGTFYFHDEELGFYSYPLHSIAYKGPTLDKLEVVGNIHDTEGDNANAERN